MNEAMNSKDGISPSVKFHPNVKNLIGATFGYLTVVERAGTDKHRNAIWMCRCVCGMLKPVPALPLRQGKTKSCGCKAAEMTSNAKISVDLLGQIFGRLTVTARIGRVNSIRRETQWSCLCECGNVVPVGTTNLRSGNSLSCGCLQKELLSQRQTTHGLSRGGTKCPELSVWHGMMRRCTNPESKCFHYYGKRGITICDRWMRAENFVADMYPRPEGTSIDRANNNGGYWCGWCSQCKELQRPSNCRWVTPTEQMRNTRSNRKILFEGEWFCLIELAEIGGLTKGCLGYRLDSGMSIENALNWPTKKRYPK